MKKKGGVREHYEAKTVREGLRPEREDQEGKGGTRRRKYPISPILISLRNSTRGGEGKKGGERRFVLNGIICLAERHRRHVGKGVGRRKKGEKAEAALCRRSYH